MHVIPAKEANSLETCIVSGKGCLEPQDKHSQSDPSEEQQMLSTLNPSQRRAVTEFLQLDQGLQLIQGPPGTGKTTTVIQLLGALQKKKGENFSMRLFK